MGERLRGGEGGEGGAVYSEECSLKSSVLIHRLAVRLNPVFLTLIILPDTGFYGPKTINECLGVLQFISTKKRCLTISRCMLGAQCSGLNNPLWPI